MYLLSLPALIKILLAFGIILAFSRFMPLFACLFGGGLLIGLWMGHGLSNILAVMSAESAASSSLWLALVITLILVLSHLLATSGQQERIVFSFQAISPGRRFTLTALPALIGLLPMPGGALFSAPMVQTALGSDEVKPELKVAINYWFRHLWEFWWPLYPGVILGTSLFSVAPWKLIAAQSPLTLGSIAGGMLFILALLPNLEDRRTGFSWNNLGVFMHEVLPIALVVAILFALQGAVGAVDYLLKVSVPWPQFLSFAIALVLSILHVIVSNSLDRATVGTAVVNWGVLRMVLTVFGIMAFKGVLVQSGAIEQVRAELVEYHIPSILIISVLPFIAGLVTGIAFAFVGASFPLVVALVPDAHSPVPYAVLAYGFGYMGMMLSPIHLCLLVTNEYFCADLATGYRYLWKPVFFGLAWTGLLFSIYRLVLG